MARRCTPPTPPLVQNPKCNVTVTLTLNVEPMHQCTGLFKLRPSAHQLVHCGSPISPKFAQRHHNVQPTTLRLHTLRLTIFLTPYVLQCLNFQRQSTTQQQLQTWVPCSCCILASLHNPWFHHCRSSFQPWLMIWWFNVLVMNSMIQWRYTIHILTDSDSQILMRILNIWQLTVVTLKPAS